MHMVLPFWLIHTIRFLPREKGGPKTCYRKKRGHVYIFTDVSNPEGLHISSMQASDTHRYIYDYNGSIT